MRIPVRHGIRPDEDNVLTAEDPAACEDFRSCLNPDSLEVLTDCMLEPGLDDPEPETGYQFERMGYFCADRDSRPGHPVFNRTVTLRDTWAKIQKKQAEEV